jgi:aspartyl protease family protein
MTKGKIYQLSRYGNLLIVNAAVRGKNNQIRQIKLLVDTGSSYTVIRSTLLKSIGYDSQKYLSSVRITTVSGIINAPVITVLWFSCLGQQIKEFPLVAYNLPPLTYVEGLLGIDFLNQFPLIIYPQNAEIWYV